MINESMMMHGTDYAGEDLAGWWYSEKLNGVRAYWDGSSMWTRGGREVAIPAAWRAALPADLQLDGEIWAGYGGFETARLAAQCGRFTPVVQFMAFDVNVRLSLEARIAVVRAAMQAMEATHCGRAVAYWRCWSTVQALAETVRVRLAGGEGLVAHHPDNVYRPGLSRQILKLKDPANVYELTQEVK